MSNEANHYEGQVKILQDLQQHVWSIMIYLDNFKNSYSEKIDEVESKKLMLNYIRPLKNKALPEYRERVEQSIEELKRLDLTIKEFIEHLNDLIAITRILEDEL